MGRLYGKSVMSGVPATLRYSCENPPEGRPTGGLSSPLPRCATTLPFNRSVRMRVGQAARLSDDENTDLDQDCGP
jgi:hypothetical protein